jgi:hypothetical protein
LKGFREGSPLAARWWFSGASLRFAAAAGPRRRERLEAYEPHARAAGARQTREPEPARICSADLLPEPHICRVFGRARLVLPGGGLAEHRSASPLRPALGAGVDSKRTSNTQGRQAPGKPGSRSRRAVWGLYICSPRRSICSADLLPVPHICRAGGRARLLLLGGDLAEPRSASPLRPALGAGIGSKRMSRTQRRQAPGKPGSRTRRALGRDGCQIIASYWYW